MGSKPLGIAAGFGFALTVLGANWALERWGFVNVLGMTVPAGAYFAGLAFGLRDIAHDYGGHRIVFAGIGAGAILSWLIEPQFALASAVAFGLSELLDMAVYTPLRARNWVSAVVASNVVGSVADSVLFLSIAFGTVAGWWELTAVKAVMILPALVLMAGIRHFTR